MTPKFRMTISPGGLANLLLVGKVTQEEWRTFCRVCDEFSVFYEGASRCRRGTLEQTAAACLALGRMNLPVGIPDAVRAAVKGTVESVDRAKAEKEHRLEGVRSDLDERGLQPYPFQVEGIAWLRDKKGAILADSPGLGKSMQALLSIPTYAGALVVCPATIKQVWVDECHQWRADLQPRIIRNRREFVWPRPNEVLITNYEALPLTPKEAKRLNQRELWKRPGCDPGTILIPDEAHALKNPQTQRTRRFRALSLEVQSRQGKVWALTGTPILNRPDELYSLLVLTGTDKKVCPGGWDEFLTLFHAKPGMWGVKWGTPKPELIERLRGVMLRRRKEDVLPQLPAKSWSVIHADIDPQTRAACDIVEARLREKGIDLRAALERSGETKGSLVAFEEMAEARALLALAKVPALMEVVEESEEAGEPLVVFSVHKKPLEALRGRAGWGLLTGDTPTQERSGLVELFQSGQMRGLALTIAAGGLGLTLTRGSRVVFVDLAYTPAQNLQAEDRLCRIGQTRGVQVIRLVADHTLDERLFDILAEKQRLIEATIEKAAVPGGTSDKDGLGSVKALLGL